ncbi:MAG: membrane dipeptidase [Desulfobacula sp.]|jgi:membrane dipeptidase|uniref:dipeptidase n=2 Tax=Desulfobacula sp. TaxID=2593537 RepID=UPI001D622646|nr:membrane dipeptidase [Desulfobacula sp.]MBT3803567.1 membrane dipeptidase [Desulfobacula sp.]MBT4025705.1 membrane dipeptidase [Desulfobacula sp.]MBT4199175.1 membrane dipeptidase [Desulfobacula sp.]MBT4874014.1 membrane dipeptidase [Desulfobacula sp.]
MKKNDHNSLHAKAIVIDGLQISNWSKTVFQNNQKGGVSALTATIAVHENFRETIRNITEWDRMFKKYSDLIMPVRTTSEIQLAKSFGKTGIILGFQNSVPIEDDLDLLTIFHKLGVRVIQLTYMEANYAGQGCLECIDAGLTGFGREMIGEMNRLGILVDLSHVGYQTTMEAIETSAKPVAFTHANPKSLWDHPRNKSDDQLKAIALRGGVIGATIFPAFLPSGNKATIEEYIDVIIYLIDMVGIDHVAIGTDFTENQPRKFFDWLLSGKSKKGPAMTLNHPLSNPRGIQYPGDFPNITKMLLARGMDAADIEKILGLNWLRLYREVWEK